MNMKMTPEQRQAMEKRNEIDRRKWKKAEPKVRELIEQDRKQILELVAKTNERLEAVVKKNWKWIYDTDGIDIDNADFFTQYLVKNSDLGLEQWLQLPSSEIRKILIEYARNYSEENRKIHSKDHKDYLTEEEIKFLDLLSKGDSYKQMNQKLHIPIPTLKGWRSKLMKLHSCKNTKQLISWYRTI